MQSKQKHTRKGLKPPKRHTTGNALKVYWPYLPMIALLLGGLFLNVWQPLQVNKPATLAYATEMSRSGLLSATNTHRSNNGKAALALNAQLNSAAQAKANDMVSRNYWAHNTPDGNEPWVFVESQGYGYTKAGENLAYGYSTSSATVIGWMNSTAGHKENMLDSTFTEVGFGFADASDYMPREAPNYATTASVGNQTIVVAFYAKPYVAPVPEPTPVPQPQSAPASNVNSALEKQEPEIAEATPKVEEPVVAEAANEDLASHPTPQPVNTDNPINNFAESQRISRIQILTRGVAPWSAILVSSVGFIIALVWIAKHFVLVRRYIIEGEHFVAHHPILDLIVLALVAAAVYLSQSSGVIL